MSQSRSDPNSGYDTDPQARYAIYFAPHPDTPLWRFGSSVLGYDSARGEDVAQPRLGTITSNRLAELTRRPRIYGFHATIKPPIRLAEGCDEAGLIAALDAFCADCAPVTLAPLVITALGEHDDDAAFLALVESGAEQTPALRELEARAIVSFEPFRAPLTAREYARRNPQALSPRKRALLDLYGYPAVLDAFTFHMTLSGRVSGEERAVLEAEINALRRQMLPDEAAVIDHLALCRQLPGEPFRILHRASFGKARLR